MSTPQVPHKYPDKYPDKFPPRLNYLLIINI